MKLSTKGRYAVLAMMELAMQDKKGLLPLADLSLSQDISISYLEQLFARLRSNDLVAGVRGPRGGYRLARNADEISIAEIVKAVDEKANPFNENVEFSTEDMRQKTNALWTELSRKIYHYLDSIPLSEAVRQPDLTGSGATSFSVENRGYGSSTAA
jgi:Rrf2 family iron-sulfur cluster assembly transcriptional regulator